MRQTYFYASLLYRFRDNTNIILAGTRHSNFHWCCVKYHCCSIYHIYHIYCYKFCCSFHIQYSHNYIYYFLRLATESSVNTIFFLITDSTSQMIIIFLMSFSVTVFIVFGTVLVIVFIFCLLNYKWTEKSVFIIVYLIVKFICIMFPNMIHTFVSKYAYYSCCQGSSTKLLGMVLAV